MVIKKCSICGQPFSVPKYAVDYVHKCRTNTGPKYDDRVDINIEGQYANRGGDQYPFTRSDKDKKDSTHVNWRIIGYNKLK